MNNEMKQKLYERIKLLVGTGYIITKLDSLSNIDTSYIDSLLNIFPKGIILVKDDEEGYKTAIQGIKKFLEIYSQIESNYLNTDNEKNKDVFVKIKTEIDELKDVIDIYNECELSRESE